MVTLLLTSSLAGAAGPSFSAEVPADALIATHAWAAAARCTQREAPAHPEVRVTRGVIPGGWLGRAHVDERGLHRLDISASPARVPEVIVHEIAHAWVSKGDTALVEGAAELLADCIVREHPGLAPLQFDDGRSLTGLHDLRRWDIAVEGAPLALIGERTDVYLGAARLMRSAAVHVEPTALWSELPLDWARFQALLAEAGATPLIAAIQGGVTTQRAALEDLDRDGLTSITEAHLGTNPHAYDSDQDGLWDGALSAPKGAISLPLDGSTVCVGPGWSVEGNLRGIDLPPPVAIRTPAGAQLVKLGGVLPETIGGLWVHSPEPPEAPCRSSKDLTVYAHDPAQIPRVEEVYALAQRAQVQAEVHFGHTPGRLVLSLGGPGTLVDEPTVHLAAHDLSLAQRRGELERLVTSAVMAQRLWATGERDWTTAEAMAHRLLSNAQRPEVPPGRGVQ